MRTEEQAEFDRKMRSLKHEIGERQLSGDHSLWILVVAGLLLLLTRYCL